ncbi:MAG: peptidylprolyl isomerase [Planctomycetota bacterium]|jgi:parvulin-like peptidyl-prolyl isomerase
MRHGVPTPALVAACIALAAGPARAAVAPGDMNMKSPAAKVGEETILVREIERYVNQKIPRASFHRKVSEAKRDVLRREALEVLTVRILAARDGERRGIDVTKRVDAKVEETKKSLESRKPKPVDFVMALKQAGMTIAGYRATLAREFIAEAVEKADVTDRVKVTDDDVKRYYDEHRALYQRPESVRLKHFVIKANRAAYAKEMKEAGKKAEEAIKEIKAGASFEEVAKRLTGKPPKGREAGEDFIHRGGLMKSIEDAVFKTKAGEFCPILQSIYGCHVVKVLEKKPPQPIPLEKVAPAVRKRAETEERDRIRKAWVAKLREGVEIEILWDRLKAPPPGSEKVDPPKARGMMPGMMPGTMPGTMKKGPHGRQDQ